MPVSVWRFGLCSCYDRPINLGVFAVPFLLYVWTNVSKPSSSSSSSNRTEKEQRKKIRWPAHF